MAQPTLRADEFEPSKGRVRVFPLTDVGCVREANEDSFLVNQPNDPAEARRRGVLVAVADGMGGSVGGARASRLVIETLDERYYAPGTDDPTTVLADALHAANEAVHRTGQEDYELRGMGSTCTAAAILPNEIVFAHVGDTRLYLIRDHRLLQLTDDHSKVAMLVRDGLLTQAEAESHPERNVILRSLGPKPSVQVDTSERPIALDDGDVLVLCSDGLTGHVADNEILEIVDSRRGGDVSRALVDLAKQRGGSDNITVICVEIGPRKLARKTASATGTYLRRQERSKRRRTPIFAGAILAVALVTGLFAFIWSRAPNGASGTQSGDGSDAVREGSGAVSDGDAAPSTERGSTTIYHRGRLDPSGIAAEGSDDALAPTLSAGHCDVSPNDARVLATQRVRGEGNYAKAQRTMNSLRQCTDAHRAILVATTSRLGLQCMHGPGARPSIEHGVLWLASFQELESEGVDGIFGDRTAALLFGADRSCRGVLEDHDCSPNTIDQVCGPQVVTEPSAGPRRERPAPPPRPTPQRQENAPRQPDEPSVPPAPTPTPDDDSAPPEPAPAEGSSG